MKEEKIAIINNFSKEEERDAVRVYDKMKLAYDKDIAIFTNSFYTPNIWGYFLERFNTKSFKVDTSGVFDESERRVVSFNNTYNFEYPIVLLEIENKSSFYDLKHKDYLGAILALGIDREKIGDIKVFDNKAYVPVIDEIWEYVYSNLTSVAKATISIKKIDDISLIPKTTFEEEIVNVASLRVDNFIAKIAKISRTKALELLDGGKVLLDYTKVKNKSQEVSKDSRLTIRGIGKFVIGDIVGESKSGKLKVKIKKYT